MQVLTQPLELPLLELSEPTEVGAANEHDVVLLFLVGEAARDRYAAADREGGVEAAALCERFRRLRACRVLAGAVRWKRLRSSAI